MSTASASKVGSARRVAGVRGGGGGGGSIAVVIVERSALPTVVLASEVSSHADAARLLEEHGVTRVVRVVPSSRTLVRVAPAPEGEASEALAALALRAEAEFGDRIRGHRWGYGILPGTREGGEQRALLTAWAGDDNGDGQMGNADERWVVELVALAQLRGRSSQPAWSFDAAQGSVSVLAERNGHISWRAARGEQGSPEAWERSVRAIIDETTNAVGMVTSAFDLADRRLAVELGDGAVDDLCNRVGNLTTDEDWLDRFGLALGAALVELDDDPMVRSFASLRTEPERASVPALARLGSWLSVPAHAATVAIVSLALAVLAPLGVSMARLAVLDAKLAGLEEAQIQRDSLETRAAMYAQLDRERLPMTKLLADIAGAAPVDAPDLVLIDLVRITADRELTIDGIADTPELVSVFQKNLNSSGLFQGVTVARSEASRDGVSFTLTARITNQPYRIIAPSDEGDFIARSTAARLYGEGATARVGGGKLAQSESTGGNSARPAGSPVRERAGRSDGADEQETTRGRPARIDIPEVLTEEALQEMSRSQLTMGFAKRRNVVQSNPDLEPETVQRLNDEIDKMKARLEELKGGG